MGSPATSPCPAPGMPGGMQAREPQSPGSGHCARALQRGEEWGKESVLPQCQAGGASAVPAGRRFTAPGAGSSQRKSLVLHFQRMLPAAPEGSRLQGGPGSSRLKTPLQGAAVGAGEGQGPEGAVEIRNTPSSRSTHAELVLGPRPWGGLLLLLRTFLAAPPGV